MIIFDPNKFRKVIDNIYIYIYILNLYIYFRNMYCVLLYILIKSCSRIYININVILLEPSFVNSWDYFGPQENVEKISEF